MNKENQFLRSTTTMKLSFAQIVVALLVTIAASTATGEDNAFYFYDVPHCGPPAVLTIAVNDGACHVGDYGEGEQGWSFTGNEEFGYISGYQSLDCSGEAAWTESFAWGHRMCWKFGTGGVLDNEEWTNFHAY